jgi:hypothetical protein
MKFKTYSSKEPLRLQRLGKGAELLLGVNGVNGDTANPGS